MQAIKYLNQKQIPITKEMINNAPPHSIIYADEGYIEHPWFNNARPVSEGGTLEDDGRSTKVKYVIFRGGIADRCIYHSMDGNLVDADYFDDPIHLQSHIQKIADHGAKLHNEHNIRAIVECTDEVFEMYRH